MNDTNGKIPDATTPEGAMNLLHYVVDTMPSDVFAALNHINKCFQILEKEAIKGGVVLDEYHESFLGFYAVWKSVLKRHGKDIGDLNVTAQPSENVAKVMNAIKGKSHELMDEFTKEKYANLVEEFESKIVDEDYFVLSDDDVSSIQEKINLLRDLIQATDLLTEEHRLRLLRKLEALQRELHKKQRDFDRYWGLVVETAAYLGDAGRKAKPMVDLIKEIKDILWGNMKAQTGLPPAQDFPLLEDKSDDPEG